MKNQLYILILTLLASNLAFPQSKGKPIIDMHQHARFKVWLDENGKPYPKMCFPVPCETEPAKATKGEDILRITLEEMEKYNIVKAVVSDENLDEVYKWKSSAPDKFIAGCAFFSIGAARFLELSEETIKKHHK